MGADLNVDRGGWGRENNQLIDNNWLIAGKVSARELGIGLKSKFT